MIFQAGADGNLLMPPSPLRTTSWPSSRWASSTPSGFATGSACITCSTSSSWPPSRFGPEQGYAVSIVKAGSKAVRRDELTALITQVSW